MCEAGEKKHTVLNLQLGVLLPGCDVLSLRWEKKSILSQPHSHTVLHDTVGHQSAVSCFSTTLGRMFHISQQNHHSCLHTADSSSMPQQDHTFSFPACLFVSWVLHNRPLFLLFITFYWCCTVTYVVRSSKVAITGPSFPNTPMLSPHCPRL